MSSGTTSDPFDLVVIGGGINGSGIARDAAGRGLSVALVERGDLAQGTSSASTKLIHGGLRYLEHYEFALVRESLIERERLWAIAPHIIWPLRFVLPNQPSARPRWLVRLGLFLYDHIGGRKRLPPARSIDLRRDPAGAPLRRDLVSAFEYSDCWVDDARLVVLNVRDAADHGASIFVRHDVTTLARTGDCWTLALTPADGPPRRISARAVINAAGPSVLDLLERAATPHRHGLRQVRGSHIVVPRKFDHDRAYFGQNDDGRIFFAIPYERDFTLIGTTDADHHGPVAHVTPSAAEIDYLCAAASHYFAEPVTPADVVWSYAGVRPLIDDGSGRPEAATRGYSFERDDGPADAPGAPLLSIFGGKITTYRQLAEDALDQLADVLPLDRRRGWTRTAALPGGDFSLDSIADTAAALAARYPFIPDDVMQRLFRSYGTAMADWLGAAQAWNALGTDFGHGLTGAEVDYLIAREWARSSDDILWRRTKLGLRFTPEQRAALDAYLAAALSARTEPS